MDNTIYRTYDYSFLEELSYVTSSHDSVEKAQQVWEFLSQLFWELPHFSAVHCFFRGCFHALEDIMSASVAKADHITPLSLPPFFPTSSLHLYIDRIEENSTVKTSKTVKLTKLIPNCLSFLL